MNSSVGSPRHAALYTTVLPSGAKRACTHVRRVRTSDGDMSERSADVSFELVQQAFRADTRRQHGDGTQRAFPCYRAARDERRVLPDDVDSASRSNATS